MLTYTKSKSNLKILSIFIVAFTALMCKTPLTKQQVLVDNYFNDIKIAKDQRSGMFVIFPSEGCFGCSSKTMQWLLDNKSKTKNYKLIFGNRTENKKYLDSLQNQPFQLYYDDENKMNKYEFGYGYPFLISIDDNNEVKIIPFNPESKMPFGF